MHQPSAALRSPLKLRRLTLLAPMLLACTQALVGCAEPQAPQVSAAPASSGAPSAAAPGAPAGQGKPMAGPSAVDTPRAAAAAPWAEQLPAWRKWAEGTNADAALRQEALVQLAGLGDPAGVALAMVALADRDEGVQATAAAVLAEYGSPRADVAKPALLAALGSAKVAAQPMLACALVELGDHSALEQILAYYRSGELEKGRRLDGGEAFDADLLVDLIGHDRLAASA